MKFVLHSIQSLSLLAGCSKSDSGEAILNPFIFKSFSESETEIIPTNVSTIEITNYHGGIAINGWSFSGAIRIFAQKTIKSVDRETAF